MDQFCKFIQRWIRRRLRNTVFLLPFPRCRYGNKLVMTPISFFRRRKSGNPACRCGGHSSSSSSTKAESVCYAGGPVPAPANLLELKMPVVGEVYDNPNYSHILIGGQPFFILPSGELSGHVPVPSQGERLSPVHQQQQQHQQQQHQQHLYLGQGSSTYRSGER